MRQLFFLDAEGFDPLIITIKKDKVFLETEHQYLECLEPEKLMTAIFWSLLDEEMILVGNL